MFEDKWGSESHVTQSCEVTEVRCKFCGSTNTVKYGVRDQVQQYMCNDCGRKFTEKDTLEGKQTPVEEMGAAMSMYYDGLSLSAISRQLEGIYHDFVNPSTIYRWIIQYSQAAAMLLELYKAKVSTQWVVDETVVGISGENYWYWDVIDEGTRFLINTHLSRSRRIVDVVALFQKCRMRTDVIPQTIISDKMSAYIDGIERVFGADTTHVQSHGMASDTNINLIERFHGTLKQRTKVMRELKSEDAARVILDGFVVNYNFFRHHSALGDTTTPAQAAGIWLPFDTWEGLLRSL